MSVKLSSLSLELYECNRAKLNNKYIRNFLYHLPAEIKMRRIGEPWIRRTSYSGADIIQGFVVLGESHASVYAWPDAGFAYVGILSCKPFDKNKTSKLVAGKFAAQRYRKVIYIMASAHTVPTQVGT